jgi:transcriptional regulator with XRE-family HTH domain
MTFANGRLAALMITATQLRAARALLDIDQRELADLANLSVPTIQRMEASEGVIRGNVDSLMKLVTALDHAGIELINEGATSSGGGRGLRLRETRLKLPKVRGRSARPSAGRAA